MSMRQYSISTVSFAWNGLDFKEGLGVGTSITLSQSADAFSQTPLADGGAVRVYNTDESGTVSVLVDPQSQLNADLHAIHGKDKRQRKEVKSGKLTDNSSGQVQDFVNMYISTTPNNDKGTELALNTWVFTFERLQIPDITAVNSVGV